MAQRDGSFDLPGLARAIEARDAETQILLYAETATVTVIDPDHPPRSPMTLRGLAPIAAWIRDLCSLTMTHRVLDPVDGGDMVSFTEEGRHRDGTMVVSTTTAAVADGVITRQRVVLVWDGWE